jgi:hypothetical protein
VRSNASRAAAGPTPRFLLFGAAHKTAGDADYTVSATRCALTEIHVEVVVTYAHGRECAAARMRRSIVDKRHAFITPLDNRPRMEGMLLDMPKLARDLARASVAEFLRGAAPAAEGEGSGRPDYIHLSEVVPPALLDRQVILINNAYQSKLLVRTPAFRHDNPTNLAVYGYDFGTLPADGSVEQSVEWRRKDQQRGRAAPAIRFPRLYYWRFHSPRPAC